mmetsp:Transcript_80906/g.262009  ORF Transcript_80906/g.262009 Transcript_80906/m.262009 type:complete len:266 (-) Transcript_80906:125-922(-)
MPLPPIPTPPSGCPGCAFGARCLGQPGQCLYLDDFDPERRAYCVSCWEAEPEAGVAPVATSSEAGAQAELAAGLSETLRKRIAAALSDKEPPLLHPHLELYASSGPGDEERTAGSVCVVFADSREGGPVGRHTLAAFAEHEEAATEGPLFSFPIGPVTRLVREDHAKGDGEGRMSCAYRLISGANSWLLIFPGPREAMAFARDFRVRSRLMNLALRVSRLTADNARLLAAANKGGSAQSFLALIPAVVMILIAFWVAKNQAVWRQ